MNKNWPTRYKDIYVAQRIMEKYAQEQNSEALGLFEIVVNEEEKRMDYQLSSWVNTLSKHFTSIYGVEQGDFVTRQVISNCIINGQTIH